MTSTEKISTKRKILKVVGIVATSILSLILIMSVLLLTVLEPYAERMLKKQVSKKSKGLYDLDFDDLDINLITSTVRLNNANLKFDSAIHEKQKKNGEATPFLLSIKTKELEIAGINVLAYLLNSTIDISSILIDRPEAKVIHDSDVPQKKNKKQKNISDIATSFGIGNFNLKDGGISYYQYSKPSSAVYQIPQLNLRISDFQADHLDRKDIIKMIDMDDFYVSLENQSFTTGNKSYDFYFDLFEYSMADQELTIKAFSAIGDHTKMSRPMIAPEIRVSLFKLVGLNLLKALKTKELVLKELLIDDTYVELLEIPDLDITVYDVYRGLSTLFETTKIDHLNIDRSAVSMYSRANREVLIQKIEQVDLSIEDVLFDSLSVFDARNNLALQDLDLTIQNYILTPENNPHTFKLARMEMRTKEDLLRLENLSLIPDIKENKASAQLMDIQIPEIVFDGIDMIRAFEHSNLSIEKIAIPHATASITKAFEKASSSSGFSPEAMYKGFSFYVQELSIDELLVANVDFSQYASERKTHRLNHVEQGKLQVKGFHFDSIMAHQNTKQAPIQEINFELQRYQYHNADQSKSVGVGPVTYTTDKEFLSIRDFVFKSYAERVEGGIDSTIILGKNLSVSHLNLLEAFNNGKLEIDEILLQRPYVFVSREARGNKPSSPTNKNTQGMSAEALFKWVNPITVSSIRVVDGEADYAQRLNEVLNFQRLQGFSVDIEQLDLRPETLRKTEQIIPVENITLKATNYKFQSPDSIYTVTLDSLFYGSKRKYLTAQFFELSPDYALHHYRVENEIENAYSNLFEISTDQFSITDFDLITAYNTDSYLFGEIVLSSPEVAIIQDKKVVRYQHRMDTVNKRFGEKRKASGEKDSAEKENNNPETLNESLQNQIDKYVDLFKIDALRIEEAKFLFQILKEDSIRSSQELDYLSLLIENLQLGDLDAYDLTDLFLVDDIDLLLKDYNFVMPDSLHELRVDRLHASLAGQYIHIDSVHFEPLFLVDEYADKLEYANNRFDVSVGDINLEGIRFNEFFDNQNYIVEKLLINELRGSVYRDSRVEQNPSRNPKTVQQFVKDLPIPIQLDTFQLQNGVFIYSEVSEKGSGTGVTTLTNMDVQIINITNDSLVYVLNDEMTVNGSTNFLNESKLTLDFVFHMNHPDDLYTYNGHLDQMKFEALNPLFTNLLFVKMESGEIEKIDFSVTANKYNSSGMMRFFYNDLSFRLLNKDDPGNPGIWLKAANWSLNHLLIKSNNPGRLFNSYREGYIEVERNRSKSIFNHMGRSVLSGFVSSTIPQPLESIVELFVDVP